MDAGPRSQRWEISRKRVSSPSAAKTGADPLLWRKDKVLLDQFNHHAPTLFVFGKCPRPACEWDSIEARLRDSEHNALWHLVEQEDDERRRLGGVFDIWFHGAGMPAEREQP